MTQSKHSCRVGKHDDCFLLPESLGDQLSLDTQGVQPRICDRRRPARLVKRVRSRVGGHTCAPTTLSHRRAMGMVSWCGRHHRKHLSIALPRLRCNCGRHAQSTCYGTRHIRNCVGVARGCRVAHKTSRYRRPGNTLSGHNRRWISDRGSGRRWKPRCG